MHVIAPIVAVAVFCLAIVESVLLGRWYEPYFRYGIPVFRSRIPLRNADGKGPKTRTLNSRFKGSLVPPFEFKELSEKEIAFREKMFSFTLVHYTPLMRGLITVRPEKRMVEVTGLLNWYVPLLVIAFIASTVDIGRGQSIVLKTTVSIIIILYAIQAFRFRNISKVVASFYRP